MSIGALWRRKVVAVAFSGVVTIAGLAAAAPAAGSPALTGPLTITSFDCENTGPGAYLCDLAYTGGTAPIAGQWTPGAYTYIVGGFFTSGGGTVWGRCTPGHPAIMTVSLTDATQVTVSDTATAACPRDNS